jgi:hypothetical protein
MHLPCKKGRKLPVRFYTLLFCSSKTLSDGQSINYMTLHDHELMTTAPSVNDNKSLWQSSSGVHGIKAGRFSVVDQMICSGNWNQFTARTVLAATG